MFTTKSFLTDASVYAWLDHNAKEKKMDSNGKLVFYRNMLDYTCKDYYGEEEAMALTMTFVDDKPGCLYLRVSYAWDEDVGPYYRVTSLTELWNLLDKTDWKQAMDKYEYECEMDDHERAYDEWNRVYGKPR